MTETQKNQLALPFSAEDIDWRIAATNREKTSGLAVAYVDSRAIQARLDQIFGCENWQNLFDVTHGTDKDSTAYVCKIGIYSPERNEWIFKSDGAGPTDIEPVKGGLSGALKRAASVWGVGRYLYDLESRWVDIELQGKAYVVTKEGLTKLRQYYNNAMHSKKTGSKKESASPAPISNPTPPAQNQSDTQFRVIKCDANGKQALLSLQTKQGDVVNGYIQGNPGLSVGQIIHKVQIEEKKHPSIGKYNIIRSFERAA